jgi:hypothetical protein
MVSKAQGMWDQIHLEKTNMLWSKEEYFNSKKSYYSSNIKIDAVKDAMTKGAIQDKDNEDESIKLK